MSQALLRQQSLLLQALFGSSSDPKNEANPLHGELESPLVNRGLQAYRANGQALAERALSAAYPVVAEMMGQDSFAPLARYFWCQHPPQRGDMAQWGGALPSFLADTPQLADEPFFADVARIEWALHCAASAADTATDAASFAILGQPHGAALKLSAGVFLLASDYPVASLINAHLLGSPSLVQAFDRLTRGVQENALVWRQGFKPRVRQVSRAEHALLQALLANQSLEQALCQALAVEPDTALDAFNFNDWLGQSVQQGLVVGATPCPD